MRLAAASFLPAGAVLLALVGSTIAQFPREHLMLWGTGSLVESWKHIRDSSFYELNPYIASPMLARGLNALKSLALPGLAFLPFVCVVLLFSNRDRTQEPESRRRGLLAIALALVLLLTVLAHYLQFKLTGIPLPYERTSIFVVPLATAAIGAALAAGSFNAVVRAIRRVGTCLLLVIALYFVCSLRDSHFRQWRECADIRSAFPVVVDLCRRVGVREVVSDQNLTSSFNFYRQLYGARDIDELEDFDVIPPDKSVYVVWESRSGESIRWAGSEVVWRGSVSGLVVLHRTGGRRKE